MICPCHQQRISGKKQIRFQPPGSNLWHLPPLTVNRWNRWSIWFWLSTYLTNWGTTSLTYFSLISIMKSWLMGKYNRRSGTSLAGVSWYSSPQKWDTTGFDPSPNQQKNWALSQGYVPLNPSSGKSSCSPINFHLMGIPFKAHSNKTQICPCWWYISPIIPYYPIDWFSFSYDHLLDR